MLLMVTAASAQENIHEVTRTTKNANNDEEMRRVLEVTGVACIVRFEAPHNPPVDVSRCCGCMACAMPALNICIFSRSCDFFFFLAAEPVAPLERNLLCVYVGKHG